MKKLTTAALCLLLAAVLMSADKKEKVMVKDKGVYVVNTTTLGKDVQGYNGPTPLKVYIKDGKVQKVEFLENDETPKYWNAAKNHLEHKWDGMTTKQVLETQVDGRTGATYSSDAVKQNVKLATEYYDSHK